jgi:hypothetical protein
MLLCLPAVIDTISSTLAVWNKPGGLKTSNNMVAMFGRLAIQQPWVSYVSAQGMLCCRQL